MKKELPIWNDETICNKCEEIKAYPRQVSHAKRYADLLHEIVNVPKSDSSGTFGYEISIKSLLTKKISHQEIIDVFMVWSALKGYLNLFKFSLNEGANPEHENKLALIYACSLKKHDIIEHLIINTDMNTEKLLEEMDIYDADIQEFLKVCLEKKKILENMEINKSGRVVKVL